MLRRTLIYIIYNRALARKDKKFAFSMNWEIRCSWGFEGHFVLLTGFGGEPGGKALEKGTTFSLKLV